MEQEAVQRLRAEIDASKSAHLQKQAEVERLRSHLLSVEETYTQELLKSQTKERTLKESLQAAEERVTEQWRLGDQLNVWQDKYRQCLADKERLEKEKNSQEKSFDRLQHALQQLTRERERDIVLAQKELAQKLSQAESLQNEKDSEMAMLRRKLSEAQLGLEAAGRLTQQLDKTTAALTAAKEEGIFYLIPIVIIFSLLEIFEVLVLSCSSSCFVFNISFKTPLTASDTAKYQQVILGNNTLDLIQMRGSTQTAGWYQAVRMPTSPHIHHIHLAHFI